MIRLLYLPNRSAKFRSLLLRGEMLSINVVAT